MAREPQVEGRAEYSAGRSAGGEYVRLIFTTLPHLPSFSSPLPCSSLYPVPISSHPTSHQGVRRLGRGSPWTTGRLAREHQACGWDRRSGRLWWMDQRDASMRRVCVCCPESGLCAFGREIRWRCGWLICLHAPSCVRMVYNIYMKCKPVLSKHSVMRSRQATIAHI